MAGKDMGSVTGWVGDLAAGDPEAAQALWERYFDRLARLAKKRLAPARGRGGAEDEEDAALSAFDSFCAGVACGRFPRLDDRDAATSSLVVCYPLVIAATGLWNRVRLVWLTTFLAMAGDASRRRKFAVKSPSSANVIKDSVAAGGAAIGRS